MFRTFKLLDPSYKKYTQSSNFTWYFVFVWKNLKVLKLICETKIPYTCDQFNNYTMHNNLYLLLYSTHIIIMHVLTTHMGKY